MKFDLDDVLIEPAKASTITSRSDVDPFYGQHLPVIAAPMDTVVDATNLAILLKNKINVCMPRGMGLEDIKESHALDPGPDKAMNFISYGLSEFKSIFLDEDRSDQLPDHRYILIDIANGHMQDLMNSVLLFKDMYGDRYVLMAGNVANPETYGLLSDCGADFVRIGIGNGNGCLTTEQTGVGYPMGSLIHECKIIKNARLGSGRACAKIVADGGMKKYSDIIKALALGADYVMVGSILNQALESAGETKLWGLTVDQYSDFGKWLFEKKFPLKKHFWGMSTKIVQKKWGRNILKTSEGIVKKQKVKYTLSGWTENFESYLRSAMSYAGCRTLEKFISSSSINQISENAFKRYNK